MPFVSYRTTVIISNRVFVFVFFFVFYKDVLFIEKRTDIWKNSFPPAPAYTFVPQFGQNLTSGSNFAPQFLQNAGPALADSSFASGSSGHDMAL